MALSTGLGAQATDALQGPAISETVIVLGRREKGGASFESRHELGQVEVERASDLTAGELVDDLPSVHVPTNSRGESIAFVRNAAERQVAIFFDGASINVPWDNRLDLSMLPAGMVGNIRSASGPLAPHYGPNALAAISIAPRVAPSASLSAGNGGRLGVNGLVSSGPFSATVGYVERSWAPLANDPGLPYHQPDNGRRTNTDLKLASVGTRIAGELGNNHLRLTAFHISGRKGIAPEGDRAGARFWRYPDISHTLVVLAASTPLGETLDADSAVWGQWFSQTIDSFTDANYDLRNARELDHDQTWGARELLKFSRGPLTVVGSVNFLHSRHRQRDIAFASGIPPDVLPSQLHYSQRNWSVGGEVEYALSTRLVVEVGLGMDKVNYLRTGDKPPIQDVEQWTGRAGLIYEPTSRWRLRVSAGRKMRAATMRELFGQALNRFLINPDLKPEIIRSAEASVEWKGGRATAYLVPFLQIVDNTIDQRSVGPLRQRINLDGSTVKGIELGGSFRPMSGLSLNADVTYAIARRRGVAPGDEDRLAEKPELMGSASARYQHSGGFRAELRVDHLGRAYSADSAGILVPLKKSTAINATVAHRLANRRHPIELFVKADNLTDALIEPQAGLPAPGRTILIGLRLVGASER